ncbi:MAG: enoyl-CoA hydratase-related protein [Acidaminococcaceae bacterium]
MSEFQNLNLNIDDGIAIIEINRPKALNALNYETLQELDCCISAIKADSEVAVLIITGGGERSFVAGADIVEMAPMSAIEGRDFGRYAQEVFAKVEDLPQPVIAAVNGFALGGGCELACACDFRYAADSAKFGQPEVGLGITPGFGGTQRLPRLVGTGIGKELIYTGKIIDAQEALRIGLVNKVLPAGELLDAVKQVAEKIKSNAKVAVQLAKIAVNRGIHADVRTGVAYEGEVFGLCFSTDDQKEGMKAFAEKRKAVFKGK